MRPFLLLILLPSLIVAQALPNDIDGDGLLDSEEDLNGNGVVDEGETDWKNADTDRGGEADGQEIENGRNPFEKTDDLTYDRDGDGLNNGEEDRLGTDPDQSDTDRDSVHDGSDPFPIEWRFSLDSNTNGIADEWEEAFDLVSTGTASALDDADGDGLNNVDEFIHGTNPREPDTDRDGVADGIEILQGSDPYENACLLFTDVHAIFPDIKNHWAETYVTRLHRTKVMPAYTRIVEGYAEGAETVFMPDREITRFDFLKLALLSSCIPLSRDTGVLSFGFHDVPSAPRPHESAERNLRRQVIYTAFRHGIIQGYPDGSFRPEGTINRAEALKILLLSSRLEHPPPASVDLFSDIPTDAWYAPYVERALWHEITEGYGDGFFRPDRPLTRAEAAAIIMRTMLINPGVNGYVLPNEGI